MTKKIILAVSKTHEHYSIEFDLPGKPKATNALLGHHYWMKHKNAAHWKEAVFFAVNGKQPQEPLTKAKLSFTRFAPRSLDYDGLVASMKPIADGLTEAKVILDDRWTITGVWNVTQEYTKTGTEFIRVKVESI